MTEVRPRPSVISSGAKQNREIPLHYAACLHCQERYSPHFCLIVCHLTPDSLKSPQISNPPLVLRTTFLHGKASHTILRSLALPYESCSRATPQAGGTIKVPQTSILPALCILPLLPGKAFATLSVCHLSSVIDLIVKNVFENKYFPRAFPSIMSCISCIFFRNLPAEEGAN